jgi:hypothetical protein
MIRGADGEAATPGSTHWRWLERNNTKEKP